MAHHKLIKMNTLQKTALKLNENKIAQFFNYPLLYVKNSSSYIIMLCKFLKGIFLRNALKNPHKKQMNNK